MAYEPLRGIGDMIPVAIALAGWIVASLAKANKARQRTDSAAPAPADEEERTRRVREEVRRKALERRSGAPGVPSRPVRPVFAPPPIAPPVADDPNVPSVVLTAPVDRQEAQLLAQQRRLADQVRALEAAQVSPAPAGPTQFPSDIPAVQSPWLAELRETSSVRRAIVLREILGPPVALR